MNLSNLAHAALALLAQAAIGFSTGNWWAGAAFCGAFYFGREVAQHEYHMLATQYGTREGEDGMPWYEGFKIMNWSTDSFFDLLIPSVAVIVAAFGVASLD